MTLVGTSRWLPPEEFLANEPQWNRRCEYVNGAAFDVAKRDSVHDRIVENLTKALTPLAEKCNGRLDTSGVKLRVEAANAYYYPDLLFTCEERRADPVVYAPELVAEVAAANTLGVDMREKLAAYRTIPWLKEYLVIQIDSRQADVWRRSAKGWNCVMYGVGGPFRLESLGATLSVDQLFD
ncbi:MAG TPA: Uma2 family endonuclease [Azospirillaceae bacterium]|nr:Uma2 family endonuclease [Azospirillaceae bacterium]HRQ81444.1 Uma2 family endonuclease [Azospirillaceae bacterium]